MEHIPLTGEIDSVLLIQSFHTDPRQRAYPELL